MKHSKQQSEDVLKAGRQSPESQEPPKRNEEDYQKFREKHRSPERSSPAQIDEERKSRGPKA